MSTIEGGMVSTNSEEFYHILLSIRSHGWDRDLPEKEKIKLRKKYNVGNFKSLYTFYYPGFNLRATDLQAFIGLQQLLKIEEIVSKRKDNFDLYNKYISKNCWKILPPKDSYVSNFAFPIITDKIDVLVESLREKNVECRPLICGSINEQPFWYERFEKKNLPNSKRVHEFGLYVPNNPNLSKKDIKFISNIINEIVDCV